MLLREGVSDNILLNTQEFHSTNQKMIYLKILSKINYLCHVFM